ncbi:MAG: hypothetical protein V3R80_12060 [Candidatus Tectomicrobia bacterium]
MPAACGRIPPAAGGYGPRSRHAARRLAALLGKALGAARRRAALLGKAWGSNYPPPYTAFDGDSPLSPSHLATPDLHPGQA